MNATDSTSATTLTAVAGQLETPARQHQDGEQLITVEMVFGHVELQQRPVFDGNRMGYEHRKVTKNRNGVITEIGPWTPPLCWAVLPESELTRRTWWARLFGAA